MPNPVNRPQVNDPLADLNIEVEGKLKRFVSDVLSSMDEKETDEFLAATTIPLDDYHRKECIELLKSVSIVAPAKDSDLLLQTISGQGYNINVWFGDREKQKSMISISVTKLNNDQLPKSFVLKDLNITLVDDIGGQPVDTFLVGCDSRLDFENLVEGAKYHFVESGQPFWKEESNL